jgi:serine/threonine-protein kinase
MNCGSCGAQVDDAAAWCTACGKAIVPADKTAPGEPVPEALAPAATADDGPRGTNEPGPPSRAPEAVGTLVDGKYSVARVLGEGGMGVVYLAKDVHTGVDVVLKAMRPELAHRADIRERTLAEGRALAQIDHPNVVHLNAVVSDGKSLWLVMQFIDGESLDKTLKRLRSEGKHMPFKDALALFKQIVLGVGAAHKEGVIHRDIKPGNVLVRRKDSVAKVTDFGIAKPEEKAREGKGNTKGVIGSLWYMSPEQVSGRRDLDKRVDIYALGVVLFELLTNHVPFDADSSYELMRKHVEDPFPSVRAERPEVPAWVDEVLQKACAKQREARFSSCDELLEDLERRAREPQERSVAITAPETPLTTSPGSSYTKPGTTEAGSGSSRWLLGVLALVALGGLAVGAYGYLQRPAPRQHPHHASASASSTDAPPGDSAAPSASATPSASAGASAEPKKDPLEALVGAWKSETGRQFDAVRVGSSVEFRIHDEKEFAPADYRTGEARFILTPVDGQDGTYSVEDKIRPNPPEGTTFDSDRSRNSCQEVWTEVQGRPLRASWDGARLSVDFAKIAPRPENFDQAEKAVVACKGLRNVPASRITTVLQRN